MALLTQVHVPAHCVFRHLPKITRTLWLNPHKSQHVCLRTWETVRAPNYSYQYKTSKSIKWLHQKLANVPYLIIRNLFAKWVPAGLLQHVEASLVFSHELFSLFPVVVPLQAVHNHVLQLLPPQLHTMLSTLPLGLQLFHWGVGLKRNLLKWPPQKEKTWFQICYK